jgi:hypothetical protein
MHNSDDKNLILTNQLFLGHYTIFFMCIQWSGQTDQVVGIENALLVTKNGLESLTRYPDTITVL